jgi:hypothetical protein
VSRLLVAGAAVLSAEAAVYVGVARHFSLRERAGLTDEQARRAMRALRGGPAGDLADRELWVTLYRGGEPVLRRFGRLGAIGVGDEPGRLKIDVEVGRGPVFAGLPAALPFSFVPGLDGAGLSGGGEAVLLPDDLVRLGLFGSTAPLLGEQRMGLDVRGAGHRLRAQLGRPGARWFRLRTQGFVEGAGGEVLPVRRTLGPPRRVDRRVVREAGLAAARYVLGSVGARGRFRYLYDPFTDRDLAGDYSLPRHAGAAWFLSSAFRATGDTAFHVGAERALSYLVRRIRRDGERAYLAEGAQASIGSAALATLALVEYREATGDDRFDATARGLGRLLLALQKPDGDFAHVWDTLAHRPNPARKLLYYSGEAAYALARLARVWPEPDTLRALARALDWLTVGEYDYLAGQVFVGEDHWTCYAIEAAWPRQHRPAWDAFCRAFVEFNRRFQFRGDEPGGEDFAGAYGVTPFFAPHTTPAASRTEAAMACYALGGRKDAALRAQIRAAIEFIVRNQIGPDNDYLVRDPARARGALRESAVSDAVRIDYAQHAGSALLRAADLVY